MWQAKIDGADPRDLGTRYSFVKESMRRFEVKRKSINSLGPRNFVGYQSTASMDAQFKAGNESEYDDAEPTAEDLKEDEIQMKKATVIKDHPGLHNAAKFRGLWEEAFSQEKKFKEISKWNDIREDLIKIDVSVRTCWLKQADHNMTDVNDAEVAFVNILDD